MTETIVTTINALDSLTGLFFQVSFHIVLSFFPKQNLWRCDILYTLDVVPVTHQQRQSTEDIGAV